MIAKLNVTKIREIIKETRRIKTFILDMKIKAQPGQFAMVWLPEVDEKPMALSYIDGYVGITVLKLGEFTKKLHEAKVGDIIGIRAPLGRGFKLREEDKRILIVGGGIGVAPLAPLAERAVEEGKEVTAIIGAVTKSELLFVDRFKKIGAKVYITTDDGTAGIKGFTTDAMKDLLKKETFDACYICGPEIMMVKALELAKAKNIPSQVSLHRYFKCGIGICGACVLDGCGYRVCKEGPTFWDFEIEKCTEFGSYWRNAAGVKVYFKKK